MTVKAGSGFCAALLLIAACDATPAGPASSLRPLAQQSNGATPILTGSGHHLRLVIGSTEEELTTFSFSAVRHADGSVSGHYQYNFRARGFAIHGKVSCVTTNGTQAWVGGTVDQVITNNPGFESLLGLEMWWRSVDNGEGAGVPDQTSGIGFELVGNPTTAASWCATQPPVLPLRDLANGNIQLRP